MSSKVRLRHRPRPQAFLVFCRAVLLFYSLTRNAAQKQVAGSAEKGLPAAGAGPTTEGDAAVEARRGRKAGTARPTAEPTLTPDSAVSGRKTEARENTVPASNSLHAALWNLGVKWPGGHNRVGEVGGNAAANDGLSSAGDVYDEVEGTLEDAEAGREAAERRRVTTLLPGSFPAGVERTEGPRSPTRRGITGVRGATVLAFKEASRARTAATAARGALVKMPGQVGTAGAAQQNLQGAGRGASGSCEAVADGTAKGVAAKATAGLDALRLSAPVGNPRQVRDTAAARAGDDPGPAGEQSAQTVPKKSKGPTATAAGPSKTVAAATQEYHQGENDKVKLNVDAQHCTPSQSQPGVGGKHDTVTGLQQNGHTDVDTEGMQKQHQPIEEALRQREDIGRQTASPLHSAEGTSSGARTCRNWRRIGPHPWLLGSPFFQESVTVPVGIELVSALLPLVFYGVDEEGDVVMYLQLSDIEVGVARTQLSDEQIKSVFRFRFFVVFGWLAPRPYARAKVFIDARKFKVTDALLHGGISLATAFITSFASTVGQTPLTATPSTNSSYSAYPYGDSRATSLSSRRSSGYDSVITQVDGVSRSKSRAAAGHGSVAGCHSKDNSSSRSPSRTLNMSTGRDINSSRSIREGFDRLREVHVLEAPVGSAVFFRLAQAIVGVQIPIHFYSSPAEVLRSRFAVTTGIEKALLPGVRGVSHAWAQRARVPSKQQNNSTHPLRKSSSHRYGEPHRPRISSRHRRNPAYNGEESSAQSGAAELQNESSFKSPEAFALEKCFVEFVAYLRSNALSNSSQAYYRLQTNQIDSNCKRWRV